MKKSWYVILCFLLCLIIFVAYFKTLSNRLFFDDEELIYKNAYIQNIAFFPKYFTSNMVAGAGKVSNMYRPILSTSFALDFLVWGTNPSGYHLTNVFLHMCNTLLVFTLIYLLFKNQIISFVTALLFAVHPVHTEAVSYASGRTDPLFTFFSLLCIFFFFFYLKKSSHRIIYYFISLFAFVLALLSKESAFIVPFILLILSWFLQHKTKIEKIKNYLTLTPFFCIVTIYILLRLTVLNFLNTLNFYQTQTVYSSHLTVRIYTFSQAFYQYVSTLFFPIHLISARETKIITSPLDLSFIIFALLMTTLLLISFRLRKRNKLFLFCFLWFFISLGPSSGIIPINNITAEHYLYFPSIGFFLLCGYFFSQGWTKANKILRVLIGTILFVVTVCFIFRIMARNLEWKDPITFYTVSLKQSPWNVPMRQNLAMSYAEAGDLDRAIQSYKELINIADLYPHTHHNLANAYKEQKKYKEAEEEYYKALKLDSTFYFSYGGLYDLYQKSNEKEKEESIAKILETLKAR